MSTTLPVIASQDGYKNISFTYTGGNIPAISAGNSQAATANTAVTTKPAVLVTLNGTPVAGATVVFSVASGGGSLTGGTATTNASGIAAVGSWTLGATPGANSLTASISSRSVTFTATGTAAPVTQLAVNAGNNQTAVAGVAVGTALSVIARDASNNPVSGASVTFTVATGGGSVTGSPATTNASGVATLGSWILGNTAGSNTVTATCNGISTTFTATGIAGAVTQVSVNAGNTQSAIAGAAVATAPSVLLRDVRNNPVSGATVTFAVVTGGGSVGGGGTAVSNASGIATLTSWTLGTTAGNNSLTATSNGVSTSFTATGTVGPATQVVVNAGNGQSAPISTAVSTPPSVIVKDANNNVVSGATVIFAVASGGGSATGTSTTSNVSGIATVGSWTLGSATGANSLTATCNSVVMTFTATATAGAVTQISVQAGNTQTATAGTTVSVAPAVLVKDVSNNPVSGATVTFSVATGGGSIVGGTAISDVSGIATLTSWTLGTTAGSNSLLVTCGGVTTTITATGIAGAVTQIAVNLGNAQTATVNTNVTTVPSVVVKDVNNNLVSGASVTFAVVTGGGSVTGSPASSNASGVATVGSWKLGTTAGANTLRASCSGVNVTFTATGTPGAATTLAINAGDGQTAVISTAVSTLPSVKITDAFANVVNGINVQFTITGGSGSLTGATTSTNASGIATVGSWTLGSTPGSNTLQATSTGLAPVTFTATGSATPINHVIVNAGDLQTATVGTNVGTRPSVQVLTPGGVPVAGVSVTFAIASGSGSLILGSAVTNASGIATVGSWTLGNVPGANTLTATSTGLSGSPITFSATATVGAAANLARTAGDGQSATVSTAVAIDPAVRVTDALGNAVAGTTVVFAIASGGGTITGPTSVVTDATGAASIAAWNLGTTVGANTLTASVTGLSGSPITFSATGTVGAATTIARNLGNAQTAIAGAAVGILPSVKVTDAFGNVVVGTSVTFAVISGGGGITGAATTTNTSGIATLGSWTLGTTAGANSLTASATGLTGSPLTFTATGTAGTATTIARTVGNNQSATVGTAVLTPPAVLVTDVNGNGVSGVTVTFSVTPGNGSLTGSTVITDSTGAAAVGSWTLGATPGSNTLTATISAGSVAFQATATTGTARTLALVTGSGQSATVATTPTTVPSVRVTDALGNPVAGVTVTFSADHGGILGASSRTTDASGLAGPVSWKLGNASGTNTLTCTVGGLIGSPLTITATGIAGAPANLTVTTGNNQNAAVGSAVGVVPTVTVTDTLGNVLANVNVTFALGSGGGSLVGSSTTTSGLGVASAGTWTLGQTPGTNTVTVTATGISGTTTISANAVAGAAQNLVLVAGNGQSAVVGTSVTVVPTVRITDRFGNPVAGTTVSFTAAGSDNVGISLTTSDATGLADASSWTLGTTAGHHQLTISATGLIGSPQIIDATALPGPAVGISGIDGNEQVAVINHAVTIPPSVQVTDVFGNGIGGITVDFAITGGDGVVTPHVVVTNSAGIATVDSWVLGLSAGANALSASFAGLTGSSVIFTGTGILDASSAPVQISLLTTPAGGTYAPANVTAVWVETVDGQFVKTLGVWAAERIADLSKWQSVAPTGDVDAIMGPTRISHSEVLIVGWDLIPHGSTTPVADGNYVVQVEVVDANTGAGGHQIGIPFTIQNGRGVAKQASGNGIKVAVNDVLESTPVEEQGSCGVGSLHALLTTLGLMAFGLRRRRQG